MRRIASLMGGLMLLDGLWGALSPRSGFQFWQTFLRDKLPRGMNEMYKDYSRLSDNSIRYLSFWTALMGLLFLAMARFGGSEASSGSTGRGDRWEQGQRA